jgi:hypothetical protein
MTWLVLCVGLVGVVVFAWGFLDARRLRLTEAQLRVPGLPPHLEGMRVLHLSDVHLSRDDGLVERVIGLAARASPDVVFITGDIVHRRSGMQGARRLLTRLSSSAPIFVAPGNTDNSIKRKTGSYPASPAAWLVNEALPFGVIPSGPRPEEVTCGRAVSLTLAANPGKHEGPPTEPDGSSPSGDQCWIAGVNDPHSKKDDLPRALKDVPDGAFVVLLAHSPDIILREGARRANLIFAGHTHGGQVRFPLIGPIFTHTAVARRFSGGVQSVCGSTLIVSRGVGATRLPIRLLCPPEMAVWTLRGGTDSG